MFVDGIWLQPQRCMYSTYVLLPIAGHDMALNRTPRVLTGLVVPCRVRRKLPDSKRYLRRCHGLILLCNITSNGLRDCVLSRSQTFTRATRRLSSAFAGRTLSQPEASCAPPAKPVRKPPDSTDLAQGRHDGIDRQQALTQGPTPLAAISIKTHAHKTSFTGARESLQTRSTAHGH